MVVDPIWAEVDLSAIAHNVREIRKITNPKAKLMAVVKANAYGHGAVSVAKVALANGAERLAVARLGEALDLRKQGIDCPILILGYTPPEQLEEVVENDITQTVFSLELAQGLNEAAKKVGRKAKVHIKIDTGMGRIGFVPGSEALKEIKEVVALPYLECEGIYTHFANADRKDKSYTKMQFSRFTDFISQLSSAGINFAIRHAANSAAIIDLPDSHLDMVRAGIIIYGLYPSNEVNKDKIKLKPAMSLKARVAYVKKVPPGTCISYGSIYRAEKETVIASLPVGYADGYTRMLTGSEVLIHGQRAPVVGRICMDQCMINVEHVDNVKPGDEVVLFGKQQGNEIPIEEIAEKLGTINYEIPCMIAARVPRIYTNTSET